MNKELNEDWNVILCAGGKRKIEAGHRNKISASRPVPSCDNLRTKSFPKLRLRPTSKPAKRSFFQVIRSQIQIGVSAQNSTPMMAKKTPEYIQNPERTITGTKANRTAAA